MLTCLGTLELYVQCARVAPQDKEDSPVRRTLHVVIYVLCLYLTVSSPTIYQPRQNPGNESVERRESGIIVQSAL